MNQNALSVLAYPGLHCLIFLFCVSKIYKSLLYCKICQNPRNHAYCVLYDHIEGNDTFVSLCKYHHNLSGEQI